MFERLTAKNEEDLRVFSLWSLSVEHADGDYCKWRQIYVELKNELVLALFGNGSYETQLSGNICDRRCVAGKGTILDDER